VSQIKQVRLISSDGLGALVRNTFLTGLASKSRFAQRNNDNLHKIANRDSGANKIRRVKRLMSDDASDMPHRIIEAHGNVASLCNDHDI